jgi:hypothetical protein
VISFNLWGCFGFDSYVKVTLHADGWACRL